MPSMPVGFWNDADGSRYRSAYFERFPGVWRHGDWITITDHGSVIVHGRSDSTLNRHGIRMGSADIYQSVERLPEIAEALVIGCEQEDGGYWMPLFIVLAEGAELTDDLRERIKRRSATKCLRAMFPTTSSRRQVCRTPVPVRSSRCRSRSCSPARDVAKVVERTAVDDPDLLDWYANLKR